LYHKVLTSTHFLDFFIFFPFALNLVLISTSLSLSESEPESDSESEPESEPDDEDWDESDEPADSTLLTDDNGVDSIAASKALISDCNSLMSP
jgi:hypothetical protein